MVTKNNDRSDVGTYVITRCSRCDNDVNHVVVAKGADNYIARVKCLVCGSEHNYKRHVLKGSDPITKRVLTTGPRSSSNKMFDEAKSAAVNKVPVDYAMTGSYVKGTLIQHINWGEGVVFKVFDNKIEVIFRDAIRTLVQNVK